MEGLGERLLQKLSMFLILNCKSAVLSAIAKDVSLPFTPAAAWAVNFHSMDCELPHGFW